MRSLCQTRVRFPRAVSTSYTPADLCHLYQFPTGVVGPDQIIGIIELGGGYRLSDIAKAFATWGLPAPVLTDVSVSGATNSPGGDADVEVVLDIEIAAAAYSYCTGKPAKVRVYFAPNTDAGFRKAVATAAMDGCATVSISWGAPEKSWGRQACGDFDAACAVATSEGSIIFAASGDNLSDDGNNDGKADADFPAASPYVVGCGGTNKSATSEVVWNDGQGGGTGGGYSVYFPKQDWQIGVPTGPGRMVPDVAADADPATGYRVYVNGSWTVVGGTSAVAPLYAGLFAAIASAVAQKGLPKLGNILPWLYKHPACFVDITKGNNGAWRALTGPDPCTGLGVPIGAALLDAAIGVTGLPPAPPPTQPPSPPPTESPVAIQTLTGYVNVPILGKCPMTGTIAPAGSAVVGVPEFTIPPVILQLIEQYGQAVIRVVVADLPAVLFWKTKTWADVVKDVLGVVGLAA